MHDFYLAKEILETVIKQAKKNNLKIISKIIIDLGKFVEHNEKILPKNLKQNFQLLAKNTIAEKAKLEINQINQPNVWQLEEIEGK